MASTERKGSLSLPDWVAESLDCPGCLKTIKDPPIYLCEKGHGLCSTCREQLKAEDKSCPLCRGKLTDTRSLAVENFLEKLPKIRCKYDGCTFERSEKQLVKNHEDQDCREKPVKCRLCPESVAMSKMVSHLKTKHNRKSVGLTIMNKELGVWTSNPWRVGIEEQATHPLSKVNNDLEVILNWESYDENIKMFWISLTGTAKEAKKYEYTLKLLNKDVKEVIATKKTECLSCDMSSHDVKKATALFLTRDDMKQARTNEKKLEWKVLIKKK